MRGETTARERESGGPDADRAHLLGELERLRRRRGVGDLSPAEALRAMVPFENFTFSGLDLDGWRVGRGIHFETDIPRGPLETYWREGYAAADPILAACTPETPLASWEDCDPGDRAAPEERRVVDFFRREGVRHRTVVTLWNDGRFYGSATFFHGRRLDDDEKAVLTLLVEPIHTVLARPAMDLLNRRLRLSKGEIACLQLARRGLTAEAIAGETPYTVETVTTYLKSATRKLGATNRTQAVAEALHRKLIG